MAVINSGERDGTRRKLLVGTGQTERQWWVEVDDLNTSDADVAAWVGNPANVPPTDGTLVLRTVVTEEEEAGWIVYVTASYDYPNLPSAEPPPAGTARFRWRATGQKVKVSRPINVQNSRITQIKIPTIDLVDYKGIGDDGKTFKGVDITQPVFGFAYDFTVPALTLDAAYQAAAIAVVGKVNSDTFQGYPPGEVLLEGMVGDVEIGRDSTISFEFAWTPNEGIDWSPDVTFESPPTPVPKEGWDYLDIHETKVVDGNRVRMEIDQIDIWRVYPRTPFAVLGIP